MTQVTADQQWTETAARSAAAKLQAFHEGLTPDERLVLDLVRQRLDTRPDETAEDVAGYRNNELNWRPSPIVCAIWQEQVRSLMETASLGFVTNYTPDCSQMPPPGQPA